MRWWAAREASRVRCSTVGHNPVDGRNRRRLGYPRRGGIARSGSRIPIWARADVRPSFCSTPHATTNAICSTLVGDIVDGWRLTRSWFWHKSHNAVIDEIRARRKLAYASSAFPAITMRLSANMLGCVWPGSNLQGDAIYQTADGRAAVGAARRSFRRDRDLCALARACGRLGLFAGVAAQRLVAATAAAARNAPIGRCRAGSRISVKNAVEYIGRFEAAVALEAERRNVHGVVCGHIHKAESAADRPDPLLQRRRLSRELHCTG